MRDEIREVCTRLLARREHSKLELMHKLEVRHYPAEICREVIDEMAAEGWQSDERFAESYARSRIMKRFGPIRIGYELRDRGVSDFDVDAVAEEISGGWDEVIGQLHASRFDGVYESEMKEQARQSRFFQQRGFSHEQIRNLFSRLKRD